MIMTDFVTGLLFSVDRQHVVLIQKHNPSWQRGSFNGVGGKIEAAERPIDAMCREFFEETGLSMRPEQWTAFAEIQHAAAYRVHFFCAFDDGVWQARTVESETVGIYPVHDLPQPLVANLRWLIPLACDVSLRFVTPALFNEMTLPYPV
jgi:8-oxo-dGTP diphosphatase